MVTPSARWYLLTNLTDLKTAIHIYKQRYRIEAMFKDCKTGGYNLEGSQASPDKFINLIFLIALAMTSAWLHGKRTQLQGQQKYVCRQKEKGRTRRRHSNFWIGLYGEGWLVAFESCHLWVEEMLSLIANKKSFYQRGLRAINLIDQPLTSAWSPPEVDLTVSVSSILDLPVTEIVYKRWLPCFLFSHLTGILFVRKSLTLCLLQANC